MKTIELSAVIIGVLIGLLATTLVLTLSFPKDDTPDPQICALEVVECALQDTRQEKCMRHVAAISHFSHTWSADRADFFYNKCMSNYYD